MGLDAWHGTLLGAISTLSTVVAVLWRQTNSLRQQLDELHAEHKDDIKELTRASLELGLSVVARVRPRIGYGTSQPQYDDPEEG